MSEKKIAVFTRANFSLHIQTGWAFLNAVERGGHKDEWDVAIHEVHAADLDVMYAQMKVLQEQEFHLIIAVGALRAKVAADYIRKHKIETPMIYAGISDPVGLGILPRMEAQGNITGVYTHYMPREFMARLIRRIKPHVKRVLVPYYKHDGSGWVAEELQTAKMFFLSNGVECNLYPVEDVREHPTSLFEQLPSYDLVWSPEGDFFDVLAELCITVCNQHGLTFFSNNRAHAGRGASLVLAVDLVFTGEALYEQARAILDDSIIPPLFGMPNDRRVIVDAEAQSVQNTGVDVALLLLLNNSEVVDDCAEKSEREGCGAYVEF